MVNTTVSVEAIKAKRDEHRRIVFRELSKLENAVFREKQTVGPHYNGSVQIIQGFVSTLAGAIAAVDACDELLRSVGVET